jgi:protein-S-isoprenylcysteine O-methyltransferase Ste14
MESTSVSLWSRVGTKRRENPIAFLRVCIAIQFILALALAETLSLSSQSLVLTILRSILATSLVILMAVALWEEPKEPTSSDNQMRNSTH